MHAGRDVGGRRSVYRPGARDLVAHRDETALGAGCDTRHGKQENGAADARGWEPDEREGLDHRARSVGFGSERACRTPAHPRASACICGSIRLLPWLPFLRCPTCRSDAGCGQLLPWRRWAVPTKPIKLISIPLCRGLDRVRPLRAPGLAANETLLGSRFGWIATIHVEGRQVPYQNTTMDTRRGELLKRPLKTRLVAPAPDQASPTINNSIFTERGHFPANASQRTRRRARRSVRPPFETDIGVAAFQCGEAQTEPQAQRRHVVHRDGRGADCPAAPRSIENVCHERGPDPVVSPFR